MNLSPFPGEVQRNDEACNAGGPSFFPWLIQQFCVPLIMFFCLAAAEAVLWNLSPGAGPSHFAADVWETIVAWAAGFFLAILANRFLPRFAANGRFIWILPSALLIMLICHGLYLKNARQIFIGFFYPFNENEEDLIFGLATLPTYACIAYSLGILFARSRFARRPSGPKLSGK